MSATGQMTEATERQMLWVALAMTPAMGPTRARHLAERFGSVEAVFHASLTELEATGLQAVSAQAIATGKAREAAQAEITKAIEAGARIVTLDDPEYPPRLKQIYDPPVVLYVRGDVGALSRPGIAVVGTRHPTPYGLGMAERLASDLAERGLVIFSGMARGVDAAAHRGALHAKGKTVAVFGTGVDVIYPRENQRICDGLLATGGAIVSEFPLGTFPAPQNFPIRNRIISGMSIGVLVVEAGEYSGTRITARCALEQNREIFAVPGNVMNKLSWTPNTLIKQGAKLVATWEDVVEELAEEVRAAVSLPKPPESAEQGGASLFQEPGLGPHEKRILALLRADESTHIDEIIEQLEGEISSSEVFAALFELELAGKIKQMPGKNFVKTF